MKYDLAEMMRLYREVGTGETARRLGCSPTDVSLAARLTGTPKSRKLSIREAAARGVPLAKLAEEHSVNVSNISHITTGRSWKHIGGPLTRRYPEFGPRGERHPIQIGGAA